LIIAIVNEFDAESQLLAAGVTHNDLAALRGRLLADGL
jgi:hypothetical protein